MIKDSSDFFLGILRDFEPSGNKGRQTAYWNRNRTRRNIKDCWQKLKTDQCRAANLSQPVVVETPFPGCKTSYFHRFNKGVYVRGYTLCRMLIALHFFVVWHLRWPSNQEILGTAFTNLAMFCCLLHSVMVIHLLLYSTMAATQPFKSCFSKSAS